MVVTLTGGDHGGSEVECKKSDTILLVDNDDGTQSRYRRDGDIAVFEGIETE